MYRGGSVRGCVAALGGPLDGGVRIRFRADFDWAGIRIGNQLARLPGAVPWRFGAQDYLEVASGAEGIALGGAPVQAMWDFDLERAMRKSGLAVFEEQVLQCLLTDLAG